MWCLCYVLCTAIQKHEYASRIARLWYSMRRTKARAFRIETIGTTVTSVLNSMEWPSSSSKPLGPQLLLFWIVWSGLHCHRNHWATVTAVLNSMEWPSSALPHAVGGTTPARHTRKSPCTSCRCGHQRTQSRTDSMNPGASSSSGGMHHATISAPPLFHEH